MKQKWAREFECFSMIKNCIVLEGDIYDVYPVMEGEDKCRYYCSLEKYIYHHFNKGGYKVCFYDLINGFYNRFCQEEILEIFELLETDKQLNDKDPDKPLQDEINRYRERLEDKRSDGQISNNLGMDMISASGRMRSLLVENVVPTIICVNFASRIVTDPGRMIEEERMVFSNLMYATMNAGENYCEDGKNRRNILVLITDKVNDIPTWFYLDNPQVKNIMIPKPDRDARRMYVDYNIDFFLESAEKVEKEKEIVDSFIDMTEGMSLLDLEGICNLKDLEGTPFCKIQETVSLYKYGIRENPWDKVKRDKLTIDYITERVKGQKVAAEQALAVIKRAKTGMSGLQHSSASKPRGILFFAGPTGTGKTELAKTLAEMLFGDENACIRFDMSEFSESHSAQKLFGAPPGYVGYEAGGQLTNAVKEHPFSILLFDEIEKASASIWDKFLQILEDGRMTDDQGNTVYFSETIIIFTSNLGIYEDDAFGKKHRVVEITDSYKDVSEKVTEGIRNYFNDKGKPEVLNRIGKNLVVFNFIQEDTAKEIMDAQLGKIKKALMNEKGITLEYADIQDYLLKKVLENLEEGGRGVGNIIEEYFITPLSTLMYDEEIDKGRVIVVKEIEEVGDLDEVKIPRIRAELK